MVITKIINKPQLALSFLMALFLVNQSFAKSYQKINGQIQQATYVNQYGITWNFQQLSTVGQFANGDWWVLGPVEIVSITPDFDGALNGWQVNPITGLSSQGYDNRVPYWGFDTGLIPALPYTANPGDSIVKVLSGDGRCTPDDDPSTHPCYLDVAAVLTVVNEIPADNGASVFRPSFMGNTTKTFYSLKDLRTDLLPSLATVDAAPSLLDVEDNFKRLQLDYASSWTGRYLHPAQNMAQYGASISIDTNLGALRLMLDDDLNDKMPALIAYVQAGIDWYHQLDAGANWSPNGGHMVGRKIPMLFAAILLDDDNMKQALINSDANTFHEDGQTYYGQNGIALFGQEGDESQYWRRINDSVGSRTIRDPYGYVDGGGSEIGGAYQVCCTAQPFKGSAIAALLLPQGKSIWNHNAFFDYIDRWVEFGVWASPDPCALQDPINYTGDCIAGSGRWTELHGTLADAGSYGHAFIDNMWQAYRPQVGNLDLIFANGFE